MEVSTTTCKGARRMVPPPPVSFELPCDACMTPANTVEVETRSCPQITGVLVRAGYCVVRTVPYYVLEH